MKRYNKQFASKLAILLIGSAALLVTSCEKNLLDTIPKTQVLTNNMWKTDNLTDQGVNGVYQALRLGQNLYTYDSYVTMQGRDNSAMMNGTLTANSGQFSSEWVNLYEGVHRANDAIYGITNVSPSESNKKARLLAEVKYLRAFFYYRLNQLYKGVPIYTEPIEWDKVTKPRNSEQEVWNLILQDLTDCITEANLPTRNQVNDGKITKSTAYALRGKVYMYLKEWQKAIDDFQEVKKAGHTLFSNYTNLFKGDNDKSPEIIFSVQNMALAGYGSDYQFRFGSRSAFGSNWNTYLIHPDAIDLYQKKDGTPFNWNDYIPGYNEMPAAQREVFFLRNNLSATEISNIEKRTTNKLDMSLYLPTGNEERIKAIYADRDPRLSSNVILPYSTFVGANGSADQTFTSRWPYRQEFGGVFDLRTDIVPKFYYYPRKFVYEGANPGIPSRDAGSYDYIVIRYADVLLLWAEALNELHKPEEAVLKVNEVRNRAGVGAISSAIGEEALREEIRDEKRRELIGEGAIFFEELRWKTLKATSFYTGNGIKEVWGTISSPYSWLGDQLYTWPIPQVEREKNTSLTQNPGWDI